MLSEKNSPQIDCVAFMAGILVCLCACPLEALHLSIPISGLTAKVTQKCALWSRKTVKRDSISDIPSPQPKRCQKGGAAVPQKCLRQKAKEKHNRGCDTPLQAYTPTGALTTWVINFLHDKQPQPWFSILFSASWCVWGWLFRYVPCEEQASNAIPSNACTQGRARLSYMKFGPSQQSSIQSGSGNTDLICACSEMGDLTSCLLGIFFWD